jgi:uncharacterized protein with ParB-like and HNH nuclease domain
MSAILSAQEKTFAQLFNGDYVVSIPDYQRPYAWTLEEAGELWDVVPHACCDAAAEVA